MACIFLKRYSCKCQTHTLISSPSNGFTSISWAGKVIRTCKWPLKEHTLFNPKFNSPTARSSVSFEQKWAVSVLLALHYVHNHHSIDITDISKVFLIQIHHFHPKSLPSVWFQIWSTTLQSSETSFSGVLFPLHPTLLYFNSQSDLEIHAEISPWGQRLKPICFRSWKKRKLTSNWNRGGTDGRPLLLCYSNLHIPVSFTLLLLPWRQLKCFFLSCPWKGKYLLVHLISTYVSFTCQGSLISQFNKHSAKVSNQIKYVMKSFSTYWHANSF